MMLIIPSWQQASQDKPMQIKYKDWLIAKSAPEEEKDSIGLNKAEIK